MLPKVAVYKQRNSALHTEIYDQNLYIHRFSPAKFCRSNQQKREWLITMTLRLCDSLSCSQTIAIGYGRSRIAEPIVLISNRHLPSSELTSVNGERPDPLCK